MTKSKTLSSRELLERVEHAGRILPAELIQTLLARRIELRSEILTRFAEAIDDDWEDNDDPRWYRAVHYGFLLIAYRERKALPIFAVLYSKIDSYDELLEWFELEPAHFGPPAVPVFQEVLQNRPGLEWHYGSALSLDILKNIALYFPETHSDIVTFLRSLLPPLDATGHIVLDDEEAIDELWGNVINILGELRDHESTPQVLAMFDANLVDPTVIDRKIYLDLLKQPLYLAKTRPFDIFAMYAEKTSHKAT